MEDINAKRDARKRRILENSEKRLLKITGKNGSNELEGLSSQLFVATDVQRETLNQNVNGKISGINAISSQAKHSPPISLTNRVNYIILAIIVNILFMLQLDHLFGKTITIPYFPIMLGRLYNCINTREMHENNFLYAVLILCNIKPQLIYQFRKLVTVIHMILGDLALYIFSFTLIHYGLFYCLHNTDIRKTLNI
ncbi:hypothetical protein WH47_12726 [Habropoda laboriosa]|uniref:Calcium signal-modulating cyclophilin ligand n=1 Tax=Habropoda laboriosa TaxID=597456 RepID=A0A0L7R4X2_9HYME|nr:hypothetical protein WH47_12726 [Habropoda laboriosa]